jgi:hypothetical protein
MPWTDFALVAVVALPWGYGAFAILHGLIRWRA